MSWISTVKTVQDNIDPIAGSTLNPIINALSSRDQYLFERIDSYDDKSVLLAYNVPTDSSVIAGTVVYYKPNNDSGVNTLKPALSTYQNSVDPSHLVPDERSFVFGIVKEKYGDAADVYLRGLITITIADLLDDVSTASGKVTGPLYLSSLQAGKLTFYPGGASVFVGEAITEDSLFLAPNIDSLNQLYFNYKVYLLTKVAGTASLASTTYTITTSDFDKVGWVDADDAVTEFGYIKPAGAKFYYNVPTTETIKNDGTLSDEEKKHALLLKEALPPYPAAYTMLFMNGVLQQPYSAEHTDGNYIIDNSGIWWVADQVNYIPWKVASEPLNILLQTTKLNPNYKAAIVTSITPVNEKTGQLLTFVDKTSGLQAEQGDLAYKINIPVYSPVTPADDKFVKNISYNQDESRIDLTLGSGVVDVTAGAGIRLTKTSGVVNISLLNYSLTGLVTDIEPEESDFTYKGLHSYLRIKNPTGVQRVGFVGKFQLPESIPANTPLTIKLLAFGEGTNSSISASFRFEYAISKAGQMVTNAVTDGFGSEILINNLINSTPRLVSTDKDGVICFKIPATALAAGAFVNFRIARTNSAYTNNIGVLGVNWVIE